jgi:surface antigen
MTIRNKIYTSLAQRSIIANKQQTPAKTRPRTKVRIKPSIVAVYASTFLLIVAMVFIGYHEPQNSSVVANAADVSSSTQSNQTSVDNVVATSVVANVAQVTNLPIATSATNLAISTQTNSEYTQTDSVSATKPQIIATSNTSRVVTNYTAVSGDTADSIAAKYNISKQTLKWANNLTSDAVAVGSILRIPPVDGIIYNVKTGDTIDSIAAKYGVDKTRLVLYNDLEINGLVPNTSLILPSAILPNEERPGYVAPNATTVNTNYYAGAGAGFGGTSTRTLSRGTGACATYGAGYCTCYAYARRKQLGLPVGELWGNASSWAYNARSQGYTVNNTPGVGAIMQNGGGAGHVAIVESILPNGDLSISEMNAYYSGGGWNIVSGRVVLAGNTGQYLYIH